MAQLYSVRSRGSWGMGDFADLGDLAAIAGTHGADFLLVNPIHAAEVTPRIEPSPYLPATRRFLAPLYVRPEDIREAAYLSAEDRAAIARARETVSRFERGSRRGSTAMPHGWPSARRSRSSSPRRARRAGSPRSTRSSRRKGVRSRTSRSGARSRSTTPDLAEGEERPDEAWDIGSPLIARLRGELAERVAFHSWLQWVADDQVRAAQAAAKDAGMRIGIMHDLAVGVHTKGSDAWSLRDTYAQGMLVGAPPDMYNQLGQNWNQPPWLPDALARSGYAPLRDMIRTLLRHAGALRIDHIIGFFRLWWIPAELGAAAGTYVRYDHEAMIGVLALEAHRAGAVVIGEDLGNVEPWVRDYLSSRGILGTSVLWFEHENGGPTPPEHYREALLATVNTHDLPPTAGYLAGEHVDLRARLGLLTRPVAEERADAERERDTMLAILRRARAHRRGCHRAGDRRGAARLPHRFAVSAPGCVARRRGRRTSRAESAGHRPGVPQLAGSARGCVGSRGPRRGPRRQRAVRVADGAVDGALRRIARERGWPEAGSRGRATVRFGLVTKRSPDCLIACGEQR